MTSTTSPTNTTQQQDDNITSTTAPSNNNTFLSSWLQHLNLPQDPYYNILYSEAFDDYDSLIELTETDLREFEFKRGHVRKVMRWVRNQQQGDGDDDEDPERKKRRFLVQLGFQEPEEDQNSNQSGRINHRDTNQGASTTEAFLSQVNADFATVYSMLGERIRAILEMHEENVEGRAAAMDPTDTSTTTPFQQQQSNIQKDQSSKSSPTSLGRETTSAMIPPQVQKAFIQFIHNATYFLKTRQSLLFIQNCFHPVDLASFRFLRLNVRDLAEKLEQGETNHSLEAFTASFRQIIDNEDEHIRKIEKISVNRATDRYGGQYQFQAGEEGDFLWRYDILEEERTEAATSESETPAPRGRWYLCNFH